MKSDYKEEIALVEIVTSPGCFKFSIFIEGLRRRKTGQKGPMEKKNFKPQLKGILKGLNMNIMEDGRGDSCTGGGQELAKMY